MLPVRRDLIERTLSRGFQRLGRSLAQHPVVYIVTSLTVSLALCSVLALPFLPNPQIQRLAPPLKYLDDPEYLFAPQHSRAHNEARIIADSFPTNTSKNFDVGRAVRHEAFGRVIVESNGDSVLTSEVWRDVLQLDRLIRALTIITTGKPSEKHRRKYSDLCAKDNDRCFMNDFLAPLTRMVPMIEFGSLKLDFPLHVVTLGGGERLYIPTGVIFGGAQLSEDGSTLLAAKAVSLYYYLEADSDESKRRARQWEAAFVDLLDELRLPTARILYFTSRSLADELERNTLSVAPLLTIAIVAMLIFTMVACSVMGGVSWREAKPWIGLSSCVTVLLAVGSATGIMALTGVPLIGINLAAPFLMLGIGLDDTFVMLSAWRHTPATLSVEERSARMFGDAGVSITITSLTNVISFVIGAYSPFPSVCLFCVYSATCATCTYLLQLVLLGALIAVFGHIEALGLHGLFCYKLRDTTEDEAKTPKSRMTNGRDWSDGSLESRGEPCVFRDFVAPTLCRRPVKIAVVVVFIVYLCTAIYGCSQLREGLDRARLTLDVSYAKDFFIADDKYFKSYPYRVQVLFNRPLNYTQAEVAELAAVIDDFESSSYIRNHALTECWFREGTNSTRLYDSLRTFVRNVKLGRLTDYLANPEIASIRKDVRWANQSIVSSRCILQTRDVHSSNDEAAMMVELREIADRHSTFNVTVFHPLFVFFDQYLLVRTTTLQSVLVATLIMIVVAFLLLPSGWAVVWVAISIVSIELGVVGFMTLWGVNLDSISMINLIMCIGFSVDYSAHIAHAFLAGRANSVEGRIAETLSSLGLPVIQGVLSTLLGIVVLAAAPSYIFLTFFKTVFLVIMFGALHALVFLPMLLAATFRQTEEHVIVISSA